MYSFKGINKSDLTEILVENSFPSFRSDQIFNWVYNNLVIKPDLMRNLPGELQKFLVNNFLMENLKLIKVNKSRDGTSKFLWELNDGERVETVLIPQSKEERFTVCISVQVGCDLGCNFCATGLNGCKRNLTTAEIVDQVWQISRYIDKNNLGELRNVVYMGMGEPFLNYDNLKKSIRIINSEKALNIGSRRITVSTVGIVPKILEFGRDFDQIGLAVSIHSGDNDKRDKLMPINKKYDLNAIKSALKDYYKLTSRRITIEYLMISGFNDSIRDAKKLVDWLGNMNVFINLIPANPVDGLAHKPSPENKIKNFKKYLDNFNIPVQIRASMGEDVTAACGQLRLREE
ncbi:23S rRNA (adenine(2503)-C(2))-methyltransferase RlmN [Halanaerobiaceae bacterium Z-7014]|uniref:Probable dual-specificity RNA methyltransferase RlmN n=1 Tax=Halonatronomonas betaini TaxID=2778430 RepID=A0A931F6D6_9FIRM|nr:23S rRNA (adenine(2503)-C(2))-methyltransferase RlmN [Halonatronomonas betaini]MBF8436810.1 23S rRNA (adenine(2503)-C(2))-methyltransferase RlmN [Halonatronomonas betaini]